MTTRRPPTNEPESIAGGAAAASQSAPSLLAPMPLGACSSAEMGETQRRLLRFLEYADGEWLALRALGSTTSAGAGTGGVHELPSERCAWVRSIEALTAALALVDKRFCYRAMTVGVAPVTPFDKPRAPSEAWEIVTPGARDRLPRVARRVLSLRIERPTASEVLPIEACSWSLDEHVRAAVTVLARAVGDEAAFGVGASNDAIWILVALDDLAPNDALEAFFASIVRALRRRLQDAGFDPATLQLDAGHHVPLFGTMQHHAGEDESPKYRRTAFRCSDEVRRWGLVDLGRLAESLGADVSVDTLLPARALGVPALELVGTVEGERGVVESAAHEAPRPPERAERVPSFAEIVDASGLRALGRGASLAQVAECLRRLTSLVGDTDRVTLAHVRSDAVRLVRATRATDASARLVDACLEARVVVPARRARDAQPASSDQPVAGDALVGELAAFLGRFVVLPPHAAYAIALWILHTHAIDASDRSPRLALLSPTTLCGKGTLLAILATLVARPEPTVNAPASAVLELIHEERPTLLIGASRARGGHKADLLVLIEQGYLPSGTALRRVDDVTVRLRVFGAVAIAAIGTLPATFVERSLLIRMKRRTPGERIERFDRSAPEVGDLRRRCARWSDDHLAALRQVQLAVPDGLDARQAELWTPLLAIAEAAGGACVKGAQQAAIALSAGVGEDGLSLHELLLRDIRDVFDRHAEARISSERLVDGLTKLEGRPWADTTYGKTFTEAGLAAMLRAFDVRPGPMRIDGPSLRGYKLEWFADAFERYLPPRAAGESQEPADET